MNDGTSNSICSNVCIVESTTKKIGRPRKHPERDGGYKNRDIEKTREYQREYKRKTLGCVPRDLPKSDKLKLHIMKLTNQLNSIAIKSSKVGFSEDF